MSQLRRSVLITFLSTNANTVVQFGVTVILARLLTPAEVGIFSITVVFVNIVAVFREFGISDYLKREKELTPQKMRSALGLLISTSWLLAAFLYFSGSHVAAFYREPGMAAVLHVLSISFFLVPFASFNYAMLARNLQAGQQAIVNAVSTLAYASSCVFMAFQGMSYMALAWANVINISATVVAYYCLRPKDALMLPSLSGWAAPARFGGGAILGTLIDRVNNSIPDLVLGRISGARDVGLYSRANGLVGIFQQIVGPTINYNAMPFIARNHHAGVALGPILSRATAYLTVLYWPALAITAIYAREIIGILYGAQWVAAAPVALIICVQVAARVGFSLTQPGLMAIGRPYLSAVSSGVAAGVKLAAIYFFGASKLATFAIVICAADIVAAIVPAWLMASQFGYSYRESWRAHWVSVKVAVPCLAALLAIRALVPADWPDLAVLTLAGVTLAVVWLIALFAFRHPLYDELPPLARRWLPASLYDRIRT
ncbi:MAG: lipopolysaccharide biosynthesis protein [Proteobacteria bacterium]|nr:lipopolysaccharide biosynthesis protein [Pseudomonadota bacterium]